MRRVSNPLIPIMLKIQGIKFGKECKFYGMPVIVKTTDSSIKIGSHLTLASDFLSNLVGLYQRCVIVARNGAHIVIGDNVGMSGVTVYSFLRIEIGNNTLIGANTKIIDNDMHPIDSEKRLLNPQNREATQKAEIIIGRNVFIGCNCIILKGVHIGDNSVIGAGSVVTNDVPANSVFAGNPARLIRNAINPRNINSERQ